MILGGKPGVRAGRGMGGFAVGCPVWAALAACGGRADDDTAAVVGRVEEGMESQAAGVQAMSTQAAAAAAPQASGAPAPAVEGAGGLPPDRIGRAARDEVARGLGVPAEQVSLERVEPVRWTDASLGCAEAGEAYARVVAPGFRVLLTAAGQPRRVHAEAAGQPRRVHAEAAGRMVVCPHPTQ